MHDTGNYFGNYFVCLLLAISVIFIIAVSLVMPCRVKVYGEPNTKPEPSNTLVHEKFLGSVGGSAVDSAAGNDIVQYEPYDPSSNMTITPSARQRVLIISCYGYGNMGDNMYAEVFSKYLKDCEIVNLSDHSTFVDIYKNISKRPNIPTDEYNFDHLILGGGGLLTAQKLKNSKNMGYYLNLAKANGKPVYIISCGIQGDTDNFKEDFMLWKDTFNYAKLITVRSKKDRDLICSLTHNKDKVKYFRDMGYMFPHTQSHTQSPVGKKYITLVVAGPVHDKNETILRHIKNKDNPIVIMNMGAIRDDKNNTRMLEMGTDANFSGKSVTKYYGAPTSPEFSNFETLYVGQKEMEYLLDINAKLKGINAGDLTLTTVLDTLRNSEFIYTGRYHGMIFARSLMIPYSTLDMGTNKILWEEPLVSTKTNVFAAVCDSYNNISHLRAKMNLPDTSVNDIKLLKSYFM